MSSEPENGYTFRMGDHEITMRDSFAAMLDTTQLTDCLLVCHSHLKDTTPESGGANASSPLTNGHSPTQSSVGMGSAATALAAKSNQILRTHRVILSASSDYFRSIFSANTINHLSNGVIAVIITNVDFDDLQSIIDFIYKGQVSVGQSRIHKFLAAAQLLMVKGLMNIKLVSNDNQPLEDQNSSDNDMIQRLRNEKRLLEQEIKSLKELEKSKIEKTKRETEIELKKKFDIEKSVLSEEKQRFEAEKMKFTIEKEVFEKSKQKSINANNNNNTIINTSNNLNKQIIVTNNLNNSNIEKSSQTNSEQNHTNGNELNANTTQRGLRETPTKSGQKIPHLVLPKAVISTANTPQTQKFSSNDSNSLLVMSGPSNTIEGEGRQLRKRIKLGDNTNESQDSMNKTNDMSKAEVEDEDGEVYEVDFSDINESNVNSSQERHRMPQTLVNTTTAANNANNPTIVNALNSTPQSAAIFASTLAYHKTMTATPNTPSQGNTRTMRRSTSSHGSASTQSMAGENGGEGEMINQRKKGPGRIPNWSKDQAMDTSFDSDAPETRGRKQRLSQDSRQSTGHLYSCPYCPQVYHGNQSMQDHINGIHLNSKTQYICDYCGKVYTWRISLNKHLKTVHPNEPIMD